MNSAGGGRGTVSVPRDYPQEEKRQLPDCPNTGGGWRGTVPVPRDYPQEAGQVPQLLLSNVLYQSNPSLLQPKKFIYIEIL
jgi:hypothetical protein